MRMGQLRTQVAEYTTLYCTMKLKRNKAGATYYTNHWNTGFWRIPTTLNSGINNPIPTYLNALIYNVRKLLLLKKSIYLFIHQCIYPSIYLAIYIPIYLSIHKSIYILYICLPVFYFQFVFPPGFYGLFGFLFYLHPSIGFRGSYL